MSLLSSSAMLAPFRVRSFRFQWPADLLTSWGIEMENLVLGWYILVETGSVLALTLFWALQYLGTLLAPFFGMAGDRIGHRTVLCAMRAAYALIASAVTTLAFIGVLQPGYVFAAAALSGLIRPSDQGMRNALVGETMPAGTLMATMGVSRTTADSARIAGALFGAGLFAAFGMGPVYLAITGFYALGFLLTLGVAGRRRRVDAALIGRQSLWRELAEGLAYVWDTPCSLAAMWLAFLVNLTAFPLTSGLLPYVAKSIYGIGQTGLGTLVASTALGSLLGSIAVSLAGRMIRPARMMIVFALAWYAALLAFVQMEEPAGGRFALLLAGFTQSLSLVPMSVMLLTSAGERFRGRVMGVRMLAIYGVPIGLLIAGVLIERIGFAWAASLYCAIGLALTALIALYWRADLWPRDAPANWR
ncbi:MAG: MFS transporter [Alphaproteobacteria bacterium]|nr:MFS transporter [Alphaproteobacteria bacterium]MBV9150406.1 MFS transporter [Alphaproteobacteria bacterium]